MELTKKQIAAFARQYPHVSKTTIVVDARDYKTEKGLVIHLNKMNADNEAEHNKPLPKHIKIEVEWYKSRTWGLCPSVDLTWLDVDGRWHKASRAGYASGCGYDKHSAAVAEALNKHFKNLLYSARNKRLANKPYGISYHQGSFPYFEGGVGMECYPRVFAWLGYTMKRVASGKTYDVWTIDKK